MNDDQRLMRRAIELAGVAAENGDVPVGAVLIAGDVVVETFNEKERNADATAHAEVLALREASRRLGRWRLSDATLYVTKEPCLMCAGAILAARVRRLVYGANDPKGGADGGAFDVLRSSKTNHRLEIDAGVLRGETAEQLRRFFEEKRDAEGIDRAAP
ncbi:MAG TPA: tRNA adenosine(34) deaminase TadA [Candidatus Tumulicola sp.]